MNTTTEIAREMQRCREARIAPIADVLNAVQAQMQAAVDVVDVDGTGARWVPGARAHLLTAATLLAVLADRTLDCEDCGHHPCDCDMYRMAAEIVERWG